MSSSNELDLETLSRNELLELLDAVTEKAKKKKVNNPMGGDGSNSKTHPYDVPPPGPRLNDDANPIKVPSYSQTTKPVFPRSRVDINKQNKDKAAREKKAALNKRADFHAMKVNEAKMKRRKELDASSFAEKAKKKGRRSEQSYPGGPKLTGNETRPTTSISREAMNYPSKDGVPGNKYSAPNGPDKKSRGMKKSWQWESPMGKRRGKELQSELQSELAVEQYLLAQSDAEANRQLVFEMLTEKAQKRAPKRDHSPNDPDVDFRPKGAVKPGDPMDTHRTQRDRDSFASAGRWATGYYSDERDAAKRAGRRREADRLENARKDVEHIDKNMRMATYNAQPHRKNPSHETKRILQNASSRHAKPKPTSKPPLKSVSQQRTESASQAAAQRHAERERKQAQAQREREQRQNRATKARKNDGDASSIVGAESFFLHMIASEHGKVTE